MTIHRTPVLSLTCSCGGTLNYFEDYGPYVARERAKFNEAHAVCRTSPTSDGVEVRSLGDSASTHIPAGVSDSITVELGDGESIEVMYRGTGGRVMSATMGAGGVLTFGAETAHRVRSGVDMLKPPPASQIMLDTCMGCSHTRQQHSGDRAEDFGCRVDGCKCNGWVVVA